MQEIIVDSDKSYLLRGYKWFIKSNGYVTAKINGKFILLHRLILNAKSWEEVDHINRNKLDNRKENLRFSTRVKNMRNAQYKKGSSGITGVSFHSQNKNWVSRIRIDGMKRHLGSFKEKEEAEKAYNSALNYILCNQ